MTARSTHLVLLPGLVCTEDLFAEQIASLRGEVAISVADHTRDGTMSGIARAVLATAPNRFALCGLSMGGSIAFEMMRQAPDRIQRLALLDTSAQLIAMAQTGGFKSVRDNLWPLFVHPARHDDVALKRAVFKMMDDTGPETFIRQEKAIMSRPDSRPSLGAIHCPTLVLVGNEDALTPVSAARMIAEGISGKDWLSGDDQDRLPAMMGLQPYPDDIVGLSLGSIEIAEGLADRRPLGFQKI